ncbi:MAG: hypothetical protein JSV88_06585, partial [Candidatus Aminicenantes bacterium]
KKRKKIGPLKNIEDEIGNEYPNIRIWVEVMQLTPKNKMVCHSFIREYVFKNFDINAFCEGFDKFLEKEDERIENEPLELYQEFFIIFFETKKDEEKNELLFGIPRGKEKFQGKVCHYLKAYDFYKYIMKGDKGRGPQERFKLKEKGGAFRLMIDGELTPVDIAKWKRYLTSKRGFIWFTKHDSIPQEFRECWDNPKAANRIRDLLGLTRFFNDGIIEVQIPKNELEKESRVPTICEAGGNPYFRPAKRKDGFGRTIDLDKKCTGLLEGVHPKIRLKENFKIRYVGELAKERKEFSDSEWREVMSNSEADLVAFIEGLKDEA